MGWVYLSLLKLSRCLSILISDFCQTSVSFQNLSVNFELRFLYLYMKGKLIIVAFSGQTKITLHWGWLF